MDDAEGWCRYRSGPDGTGLAHVLAVAGLDGRAMLTERVEDLFFETGNWRAALHAAMLHLDRFAPYSGHVDLVKAFFFANEACAKSNDDPRARVVLAMVSWERRLPLAVLYDVDRALSRAHDLAELPNPQRQSVIGQAYSLRGLAYAYLLDVERALHALKQAESHGMLMIDGVVHLLLASASTGRSDTEDWAAQRIPVQTALGGQAAAVFVKALRRNLIRVLWRRGIGIGD